MHQLPPEYPAGFRVLKSHTKCCDDFMGEETALPTLEVRHQHHRAMQTAPGMRLILGHYIRLRMSVDVGLSVVRFQFAPAAGSHLVAGASVSIKCLKRMRMEAANNVSRSGFSYSLLRLSSKAVPSVI